MTSLNIVAHPDDDLLFLNPDITEDIERKDRAIVLYVTAGDDGGDAYEIEKLKSSALYKTYNSLYFYPAWFRIKSNSFKNGDLRGDLYKLFVGDVESITSYIGQTFQRKEVVQYIIELIEHYAPDIIRTHNPSVEPALTHDEPHLDHVDHIYTAKFVQEAAKGFPHIPVYAYMGYPIRYEMANLNLEQVQLKTKTWRAYQEVDTSVAGNIWDVAMSRCYKEQIQ